MNGVSPLQRWCAPSVAPMRTVVSFRPHHHGPPASPAFTAPLHHPAVPLSTQAPSLAALPVHDRSGRNRPSDRQLLTAWAMPAQAIRHDETFGRWCAL